jgi:microcystin degradation protein MlrC
MKIAILSAFHETNTFSKVATDKRNFETNTWLSGQEIIKNFSNTKTPIGGFLKAIKDHGHEAIPLFAAHATPAGVVQASVFAEIRKNFKQQLLQNDDIAAVALEIHGAHVVEGIDDPEAILIQDVKEIIGEKPIAVVSDFHANMTMERLANTAVWAGYRTNPHIDTYEAGVRSLEHLFYYLDNNLEPEYSFVKIPIIYPPIGQATSDQPFVQLIKRADELRELYGFRDLIVHGGYSFSDINYAGISFTALGHSADKPQREKALLQLAKLAWDTKETFTQEIFDISDALNLSLQAISANKRVAIADIADNINGGSAGDSTHLIHELIKLPTIKSLSTICDPIAVKNLKGLQIGSKITLKLGGWSDPIVGAPINNTATLLWFGDGTYVHEGLMNHGAQYTIGESALVRIENSDLLIQSFAQQPNDLAQFKVAGVNPDDYQIILLKGAAALRANWTSKVDVFYNASSLGMTDCILERLSYKKLNNSIWPLNRSLLPEFNVQHQFSVE